MEILTPEQYGEYEAFLQSKLTGSYLQSPGWARVKRWDDYRVVVSRGADGVIKGSLAVLVRRVPILKYAMLYAPRGPVCDPDDKETLQDLLEGAKVLAKRCKAYMLKADPGIDRRETDFIESAKALGFHHTPSGGDFSGSVQPSVVYILPIQGMDEEKLMAFFPTKTRYKVRYAINKGVTVKREGREGLEKFYALMQETGERDGFQIRPLSYFQRMFDELGEHLHLYLAYYEDEPLAGGLLITYGRRTIHQYGASSNQQRNLRPNYAMQWAMMCDAMAQGSELYDFGGIAAVDDENNPLHGLYMFKRSFRGEVVTYVGDLEYVFKPLIYNGMRFAMGLRTKLKGGKKQRAEWNIDHKKVTPAEETEDQ